MSTSYCSNVCWALETALAAYAFRKSERRYHRYAPVDNVSNNKADGIRLYVWVRPPRRLPTHPPIPTCVRTYGRYVCGVLWTRASSGWYRVGERPGLSRVLKYAFLVLYGLSTLFFCNIVLLCWWCRIRLKRYFDIKKKIEKYDKQSKFISRCLLTVKRLSIFEKVLRIIFNYFCIIFSFGYPVF